MKWSKKLKTDGQTVHKATQKRFFELVTAQTPLYAEFGNPINTYKELIHYRFKEVIYAAFPRFLELIKEDMINELIVSFIKSRPQTPFIWKMPDEFRHFLTKTDLSRTYPFMHDMLWFEWIEVEIFMGNYQPQINQNFNWENFYTLSPSARMKELHYPVYYDGAYEEGGIYPLLMFYNFQTHDVHFQEITPFLQQLIMGLDTMPLNLSLQKLCQTYDIEVAEVQELLEETLKGFLQSNILIEVAS